MTTEVSLSFHGPQIFEKIKHIFSIVYGRNGCLACSFLGRSGEVHCLERGRGARPPADELKESQEICFVSQGDYRTFIKNEAPTARNPGLFVDQEGRPLGQHDGIAFYTPGQRRGLGIAAGHRLYVQQVHPQTNTVVLGSDELVHSACTVGDLNLFDPDFTSHTADVHVKVRYATPPQRRR